MDAWAIATAAALMVIVAQGDDVSVVIRAIATF